MRRLVWGLLGVCVLLAAGFSMSSAQPPGRPGGDRGPGGEGRRPPPPSPLFEALDRDHDGVLSAEEIQAASESLKKRDKNGDGKLTEDELRPQEGPGGPPRGREGGGREGAEQRDAGGRGPGREGPSREGGPGQGGPPSVLPPFARESLNLSNEQQKRIDDLDADVRARLEMILTPEQKQQLEQMRARGPGGPLGPGGFGGPGRPGGPRGGDRPEGRGAPERGPRGAAGRPQRPDDGDSP